MSSFSSFINVLVLVAFLIQLLSLMTLAQENLPTVYTQFYCINPKDCIGSCYSSTRPNVEIPFKFTLTPELSKAYSSSQTYLRANPVVQTSTTTTNNNNNKNDANAASSQVITRVQEWSAVICSFNYCCSMDTKGKIETNFKPSTSEITQNDWAFQLSSPPTLSTFPLISSFSFSNNTNLANPNTGSRRVRRASTNAFASRSASASASASSSSSSSSSSATAQNRIRLNTSSGTVLPRVLTPFLNANGGQQPPSSLSTSVQTNVPLRTLPLANSGSSSSSKKTNSLDSSNTKEAFAFSEAESAALSISGYSLRITLWVPFLTCLFFYL